eukprot:CAMPEP_0113411498 /NCGR_PEP_ID=MMETSP0013_2-20120614/22296_1 /TAXON_ID=2843 ORGANISM="Skeletonema costatum, Strain 1716" /NCGR_SAMPLE_ID=MMETSP0013_2 /ASSEMBLY_ACC=CAM_ASM_000158 /LENGTH=42 /DNA_ID=CAMNT_0000297853 /DNA_START=36 /DNA_END=164 /DNA_ORIENTATION=+ /assembly_acc=CAM_ASM_000158
MGRNNNVMKNPPVARIRQLLTHRGGRWSSRAADAAGPSRARA